MRESNAFRAFSVLFSRVSSVGFRVSVLLNVCFFDGQVCVLLNVVPLMVKSLCF